MLLFCSIVQAIIAIFSLSIEVKESAAYADKVKTFSQHKSVVIFIISLYLLYAVALLIDAFTNYTGLYVNVMTWLVLIYATSVVLLGIEYAKGVVFHVLSPRTQDKLLLAIASLHVVATVTR